jgi:hypothetical protein
MVVEAFERLPQQRRFSRVSSDQKKSKNSSPAPIIPTFVCSMVRIEKIC